MRQVLHIFDAILNRFTMYRVVVYSLAGLLAIAIVLAAVGAISAPPLGIAVAVAVLCVVCYSVNRLLAWLLRVPYNEESWLITALILACIMLPATTPARAAALALTGAIAMASKYVLVYRGSNVLNPAAIGAFVVSIFGIVPATWWMATPALTPVAALVALIVLRKTRRFTMFMAFTATAIAMLLFIGSALHGQGALTVLRTAFVSWPIIFFGSIMLTEPATSPSTRYYQVLYAILVGTIFASQLHWARLTTMPQVALLIGNTFTVLAVPAQGLRLRLKRVTQLAPNAFELAFATPGGSALRFTPGQYAEWTFSHPNSDGRGNRRTFSIASSPTEEDILIGIKRYEPGSSFKKALLAAPEGTGLRTAHVGGNFTLPSNPRIPLLCIAGGIGITPFRSMIKYMTDKGESRDVVLVYLAASEQDFVYREVFEAAKAVGVRTEYVVGAVDALALQKLVPDIAARMIYISGPNPMVETYKHAVRQAGVLGWRIRTDFFAGY